MRYFEDFEPGQVHELGSRVVTRDEIVQFASQWDPQPFHVDEEAAARSPYGGLIASGWHTAAILMRQFVDHLLLDSASQGSPGMDELRWLAPVRPGDELTVAVHVLEVTASATRPDRGTVTMRWEVRNADGVEVCRSTGRVLFGRRPVEQPS